MHTVEDTLEILAGIVNRQVNIRIDSSDKNLIKSFGNQVNKGLALTSRQLDLALKKIDKYRDGLAVNGVNVDSVTSGMPLRFPLREIDRTQKIFFGTDPSTGNWRIHVRFVFSRKIDEIWESVKNTLTGNVAFEKSARLVDATEMNLYKIVSVFKPLDFEIDPEVLKIYEKIEEIRENRENYEPYVDLENEQAVVKNLNSHSTELINKEFSSINSSDLLQFLDTAKDYGIFQKTSKISEKIESVTSDELTRLVVNSPDTRFRINPDKRKISEVVNTIKNLNQWPILVILEEQKDVFGQLTELHTALSPDISNNEMTVFFRLDNGQPDHDKFNQFVKDNTLNNYIDESIKVVFISKNRIPKPLFKATWKPKTAIVFSNHNYGKISAYLNDFRKVYYYNNSITLRHDRIRGGMPIAEL